MKRIGPELDQLMWAVAECTDRQAVEDFEARFPEHVLELGKRMAMLRDLKGARRANLPPPAPVFVAPSVARPIPVFRFGWALGAVAMAAFGLAAYFGTARLLGGPRPLPEVPAVQEGAIEPPAVIRRQSPAPVPSTTSPSDLGNQVPTGPVNAPPPRYEMAFDLQRDSIDLSDAIRLIAAEAGLTAEIGPGLPEIDVGFDYRGTTGLAMLQDLGPRFGFTAFDEGDGRVLIIPALDRRAENTNAANRVGTGKRPPAEKEPTTGNAGNLQLIR